MMSAGSWIDARWLLYASARSVPAVPRNALPYRGPGACLPWICHTGSVGMRQQAPTTKAGHSCAIVERCHMKQQDTQHHR